MLAAGCTDEAGGASYVQVDEPVRGIEDDETGALWYWFDYEGGTEATVTYTKVTAAAVTPLALTVGDGGLAAAAHFEEQSLWLGVCNELGGATRRRSAEARRLLRTCVGGLFLVGGLGAACPPASQGPGIARGVAVASVLLMPACRRAGLARERACCRNALGPPRRSNTGSSHSRCLARPRRLQPSRQATADDLPYRLVSRIGGESMALLKGFAVCLVPTQLSFVRGRLLWFDLGSR